MADIWRNTDLQDIEGEVWKDVVGYEGLYMVSSYGRVKSLERERKTWEGGIYILKRKILKQNLNKKGYPQVCLYSNCQRRTCTVHRLVTEAFIPNSQNLPYIDHINTIRTDNRVGNLRWCTAHENSMNTLTRQHLSEAGKGRKGAWEGVFGKDNPFAIPIVQLSLKGEYIKTWDSFSGVQRELGIQQANIHKVLNGQRNHAGGYKWMYLSEYKGV